VRHALGAEGGGGGEGGVEAEVGAVEKGGELGEAEGDDFGGLRRLANLTAQGDVLDTPAVGV